MTIWQNIDPNFTLRHQTEWEEWGFTAEQTREWVAVGLSVNDASFAQWLRDIQQVDSDWVLNHGDEQLLREQYASYARSRRIRINTKIRRLVRRHPLKIISVWLLCFLLIIFPRMEEKPLITYIFELISYSSFFSLFITFSFAFLLLMFPLSFVWFFYENTLKDNVDTFIDSSLIPLIIAVTIIHFAPPSSSPHETLANYFLPLIGKGWATSLACFILFIPLILFSLPAGFLLRKIIKAVRNTVKIVWQNLLRLKNYCLASRTDLTKTERLIKICKYFKYFGLTLALLSTSLGLAFKSEDENLTKPAGYFAFFSSVAGIADGARDFILDPQKETLQRNLLSSSIALMPITPRRRVSF